MTTEHDELNLNPFSSCDARQNIDRNSFSVMDVFNITAFAFLVLFLVALLGVISVSLYRHNVNKPKFHAGDYVVVKEGFYGGLVGEVRTYMHSPIGSIQYLIRFHNLPSDWIDESSL